MKILSNRKYEEIQQAYRALEDSFVRCSDEKIALEKEVESLRKERAYVNLTRDSHGVLHRISETKMSRVNRRAKSEAKIEGKAEIKTEKAVEFAPKDGEIVRLHANTYYDDGRVYVVYFEKGAGNVIGIGDSGAFSFSIGVQARDTFSPATEKEKANLRKLDPRSEQNLRKMIDSKSSKELAEEYLGLKVGDGKICGYNNETIILGFNEHGVGWHYTNSADTILSNYESYLYAEGVDGEKVRSAILKSLNPR